MAMIEAGEAKIERVGARSGEAAGQLVILEKIVEETQNEFARGAAEGFASTLATIASDAPVAGDALADAARGAGDWIGTYGGLAILNMLAPTLGFFIERGQELEETQRGQAAAGLWMAEAYEAEAAAAEEAARAQQVVTATGKALTASMEEHALVAEYAETAWVGVVEEQRMWAAQAAFAVESGRGMRDSMEAMNQEAANQEATLDLAAQAAEAWGEYVAEATARSGDYFEQITSSGRAQYDLNDAMYAAAGAYGAGAVALGEIGVETGQFKQNVADAGVAAAQQQVIVENLAGAAQSGKVSWDEYVESVERALGILNNNDYLIDLGPREAPEMEDRGFREGYQEDFEPDTREISPYAVVLEAENQAVLDAVDEARSVVEGFVSPEEVYQAVVDLDITAVEKKGGQVQAIIDGLPDRKKILIDLEIENPALLEQLRAIGALP